jgi:hypothetical protein
MKRIRTLCTRTRLCRRGTFKHTAGHAIARVPKGSTEVPVGSTGANEPGVLVTLAMGTRRISLVIGSKVRLSGERNDRSDLAPVRRSTACERSGAAQPAGKREMN